MADGSGPAASQRQIFIHYNTISIYTPGRYLCPSIRPNIGRPIPQRPHPSRSSSGPEMRPIYRRTADGVQVHSFVGWL